MTDWLQEWWEANGDPLISAFASFDITQIRIALNNAPHAYYEYIRKIYERSPEHVIIETILIIFVFYVTLVKKSYDPKTKGETKLSEDEIEELCNDWIPEPLVPKVETNASTERIVVEGTPDAHIGVQGRQILNFATFNFLGISSRSEIKDSARKILKKYGCGSNGPRGFYGSFDTHEKLEKDVAKLLGTTDALVISDSETTPASVIPAFCKRGDLIIVDKGCHDSILVGASLSRSTTLYFEHNDMEDLRRVLENVKAADRKARRSSDCQRRFVIVEGLYRNYGDIVKLPDVLKLCEEFCFRIILDESYSIGVLGDTGVGCTEYFGIDISKIEVLCGSFCNAFASVGGFSTGSQQVVDYQRINTAGYVFSAASPPFTSEVSSHAIQIMADEPELLKKLRQNSVYMHDGLNSIPNLRVTSCPISPVLHLKLTLDHSSEANPNANQELLDNIASKCLDKGLAVVSCHYKHDQVHRPEPTLRLAVSTLHTNTHMDTAINIIRDCTSEYTSSMNNAYRDLAQSKESMTTVSDTKNRDASNTRSTLRRSARQRKPVSSY